MKLTGLFSVAACGVTSPMVACLLFVTLPHTAFAQVNPALLGTWKLNVEKSTFDPADQVPPKNETVTYEQVGDGFKRTVDTVRADGTHETRAYTAKYDGKEYPASTPGTTIALTRVDAYTVEETVKQSGRVFRTVRQVLSKDGKMMTTSVTETNASGQPVHRVRVLEKQ
jgi:hypothetical protein